MLEVFKSLLTEKGSALHARSIAGEKIQITRFEVGNGTYTGSESDEAIAKMTALRSRKESYGVSSVDMANATTCKMTLIATNENVTQGYYVTEIGIFAKGEDGVEVLYKVTVSDPAHPDWMSAYNSVAPSALKYYDFVSVGNASNVELEPGSGGVLSVEDVATVAETKEYLGLL